MSTPEPQPTIRARPKAGDRLPPLPGGAGGEGRGRRGLGREAAVVVFLPIGEPDVGAEYVARLAGRGDRFRLWGGRVVVAAPDPEPVMPRLTGDQPFDVLADPRGETRRRWGLDEADAALFVADRWGQIFHAEVASDTDRLSDADEVEEWLKYLATQCAECGVPDEPGHGDWAA